MAETQVHFYGTLSWDINYCNSNSIREGIIIINPIIDKYNAQIGGMEFCSQSKSVTVPSTLYVLCNYLKKLQIL